MRIRSAKKYKANCKALQDSPTRMQIASSFKSYQSGVSDSSLEQNLIKGEPEDFVTTAKFFANYGWIVRNTIFLFYISYFY